MSSKKPLISITKNNVACLFKQKVGHTKNESILTNPDFFKLMIVLKINENELLRKFSFT